MYEYIFTIGCFDKLHSGHIKILTKMQEQCNKLVIGIYDNHCIQQKKQVTNIQSVDVRKTNLEKYAFDIFIIHDIDPTKTFQTYITTHFSNVEPLLAIGSSKGNRKMVANTSNYNGPLFFTHGYHDTFDYSYQDSNVMITRTDKKCGWGQNLNGYKQNWCFMRANDNKHFPSIKYISSIMPVTYLSYSSGISSSSLRDYKRNKVGLMDHLLQTVVGILSKNDIPYYLDCGTLLGCIRDNELMQKDTDLDVAIHLSLWDKLNAINFHDYGLIRTRTLTGFPHKSDGNMISVRTKFSHFYCDIYAQPAFPILSETVLNGNTYSVPIQPELHLQVLFGDTWRIPSNTHSNQLNHRGKGLVNSVYSKYWDKKYKIFTCLK
jgi:cytidyltransferase-like protein